MEETNGEAMYKEGCSNGVSTPGLGRLNGVSQQGGMARSDCSLERPPEALKQRLGEKAVSFSRTPGNVSVG